MSRPIIALSLLLLGTSSTSIAQSPCNAKMIEALRTKYTFLGNGTLAQQTHDLVCNSSNFGVGGSYAGYGVNVADAKNACANNDMSYFETHAETIAYSFVPAGALPTINSVCASNNIELTADQFGPTKVIIKALFRPVQGGTQTAKIQTFIFDPASVSCDLRNLRTSPAYLLGSGGRTITCTRLNEDAVVFVLQTDRGSQAASLPSLKRTVYKIISWGSDDQLTCDVNGTVVLNMGMGPSFNGPPGQTVLLNTSLLPGAIPINYVVTCHSVNLAPPAAWYHYDITADDVVVQHNQIINTNIGMGQLPQPGPYTIHVPTNQEFSLRRAQLTKHTTLQGLKLGHPSQ